MPRETSSRPREFVSKEDLATAILNRESIWVAALQKSEAKVQAMVSEAQSHLARADQAWAEGAYAEAFREKDAAKRLVTIASLVESSNSIASPGGVPL